MKSAPRLAVAPAPRPLLQAARALPVLGKPFTSSEHFGRPAQSELRLEQSAWSAYTSGSPLPEGAQVALLWRAESQHGPETEPPWVLSMEKVTGAWRYQLERSDGTPGTAAERARCARCHAEAPTDELFRVTLEAP